MNVSNDEDWVVMFVDIEGSTRLKYEELKQEAKHHKWRFPDIVTELLEIISRATGGQSKKFTGDGAMIVFPFRDDQRRDGRARATHAAERIIQGVDRMNFEFRDRPRIHIRIGIATGLCTPVGVLSNVELSGRPADLAARLCSEADRDGVLIDDATKKGLTRAMKNRLRECDRRLMLKGVPLKPNPGPFWHYKVHRLVTSSEVDYSSKGLIAVYLDRKALDADFPDGVITWVKMAALNSSIFVAGRTLIGWAQRDSELLSSRTDLKFYFLLSSKESWGQLDEEEKKIVKRDYFKALPIFQLLAKSKPEQFHNASTPHLILDGVTFARIVFPGGNRDDVGRLVALQDLNVFRSHPTADPAAKATLFWVCTCGIQGSEGESSCTAHGLLRRTIRFWRSSRKPLLFPVRPIE